MSMFQALKYAEELEADGSRFSRNLKYFVDSIGRADEYGVAVHRAYDAWAATNECDPALAESAALADALRLWAASPDAAEASLGEYVTEAHAHAVKKGWWDNCPPMNAGGRVMSVDEMLSKLMLITTEVAEAAEDVRVGAMTTTSAENGKPVGFPTELADIVIRVFDLAGALGIDLQAEVARKMLFNMRRPARHGGKLA